MKLIPMLDLKQEYEYMKTEIEFRIRKCMEHQHWILGPEVKELEDKIAGYIGTEHCVGVSSGTDALLLSLRALAIKTKQKEFFDKRDKIITTPFTFTATAESILQSGATPVFIDIDPQTYNIDPLKIEECLLKDTGVVGIVPVHLFGYPSDMGIIMDLAKKKGLFVVEDVAQAFGGIWDNKKLGAIGDTGAFSFFPSKNLGCFGDGGMISTDNPEIADISRILLKHGGKDKFDIDHIGYNARLDTLQAAILLAKFKYIDELNKKRIAISKIYEKELSNISGLKVPFNDGQGKHVFNQYTIRVGQGKRDDLKNYLQESGISSVVYYPLPLHKMKVFENRSEEYKDLRETEKASREVLSLPIEPLFEQDTVLFISGKIRQFFKRA